MNIEWQWQDKVSAVRQPKKKRENSQISAFTSSSSLVGRAEQSRWHHYPEESEATASLTAKSNGVGGSGGAANSEPSFVSRIENQTVSVGRDVILGCQVKNLGHNYKVSFAVQCVPKTLQSNFLLLFCQATKCYWITLCFTPEIIHHEQSCCTLIDDVAKVFSGCL